MKMAAAPMTQMTNTEFVFVFAAAMFGFALEKVWPKGFRAYVGAIDMLATRAERRG
jgi:hypothetical protein